MKAPIEDRLWAKVARGEPNECWPWLGGISGRYGRLTTDDVPSKSIAAHRVAWMSEFGPIPPGMQVCHRCDNPPCCNPAHLFLGTQRDNIHDMIAKGRKALCQKIPDETALLVRRRWRAGEDATSLSEEFGVSASYIRAIGLGRSRKHLPAPTRDEPNLRRSKYEIRNGETEAFLLETAKLLFRDHGYAGVNSRMIALALGKPRALIFGARFRKDLLYLRAMRRPIPEFAPFLQKFTERNLESLDLRALALEAHALLFDLFGEIENDALRRLPDSGE